MQDNKNNFQIILLVIFIAVAVFAVLIFSGLIEINGANDSSLSGEITVWGPFKKSEVNDSFKEVADSLGEDFTVTYVQKDKDEYQEDLIEAFARSEGPDLFIISSDMVYENEDFIYKIPYTNISEKTYKNYFIDGASIYLESDGVVGFPLVVDPMVLFYNKSMLANAGIVELPTYWSDLFDLNSKLTKKSSDGSISESMIALGEYSNIKNAKEILATLILQGGSNIVDINDSDEYSSSLLKNPLSLDQKPANYAIDFYTQFSDSSLSSFSWSKYMPNSFDEFTSDNLAFYLGFASELFDIQRANPNLSFDVDQIFEASGVKNKKTFADIYVIVLNKKSQNLSISFSFVNKLIKDDYLDILSKSLSLPPATRSLLSVDQEESYLETFFDSALVSTSWIDPNYEETNEIFGDLISNVTSDSLSVDEAISKANSQINLLFE